jgi:AcrR family transcriptional regulator
MNTNSNPQIVYKKNYENQLARILESAEKLFIRDGIERVSMNAIANEAHMARNTLYKYFSNKQEIAFAILERFIEKRTADFNPEQIPQGTGFQRLEFLVMDIATMLEQYPDDFRFMVEFNVLYAREGNPQRVRQLYAGGDELINSIIQQGIADGSIRSGYAQDFLIAALYNLISAMNLRFSLAGNLISEECNQPVKELYLGIFRIFLQGIQSAAPDEQRAE